jgi:predicted phosphoribosyltransferase/dienelactone hydrolase
MPPRPRHAEAEHGPDRFADRQDAGRRLAARLGARRHGDALVLALPRGGVPVALEVARALGAPLDVLVARKLGAPWQPELAMGAIAPDGVRVLNEDVVQSLGVTRQDLERATERERAELERRVRAYRGERPFPPVRGRTVVLVDDGIATGATARAAIAWLRQREPARLVLAVPVIAAASVPEFRALVDEVVYVLAPADLQAIGLWYDDFAQVSDGDVVAALEAAERPPQAPAAPRSRVHADEVTIQAGGVALGGTLQVPAEARGLVLFAHGSGSSRLSPRNRAVAAALRQARLGTLLMDLLTPEEEEGEERGGMLRFDVGLLAERLAGALDWLASQAPTQGVAVGLFGASAGAAAALRAAAAEPTRVVAVVSRGGRPDLAGDDVLARVRAPTLLIVGGADDEVLDMNRRALARLRCEKHLEIVPGASHLFPEPGALEQVARLATAWFLRHLAPAGTGAR